MPSFDTNARPETFVSFIHYCIIDYTSSQVTPDLRQTLLQFIDVMNLMSVANVSVHASAADRGPRYMFQFSEEQKKINKNF